MYVSIVIFSFLGVSGNSSPNLNRFRFWWISVIKTHQQQVTRISEGLENPPPNSLTPPELLDSFPGTHPRKLTWRAPK